MRAVVVGATGNVGTSVLGALAEAPAIESVVGVARRVPSTSLPKVEWHSADVTNDDLDGIFHGADVVIHLAWAIQPSHDRRYMHSVNVEGSKRVFASLARAEVPAVVYASSVGVYSPGPKHDPVDETWPTGGIFTSDYSMQKAEMERFLDRFETENPAVRAVRIRPGLVLKGDAASEIHRYFIGRWLPPGLLRPDRLPVIPLPAGLAFQGVHASDVGRAMVLAATRDVRGAFNVAAEPLLDTGRVAEAMGTKAVEVPAWLLRSALASAWQLRLVPTAPGWLDLVTQIPAMSTARARDELGWQPEVSSQDALSELLSGLPLSRDWSTPPLRKQ